MTYTRTSTPSTSNVNFESGTCKVVRRLLNLYLVFVILRSNLRVVVK